MVAASARRRADASAASRASTPSPRPAMIRGLWNVATSTPPQRLVEGTRLCGEIDAAAAGAPKRSGH